MMIAFVKGLGVLAVLVLVIVFLNWFGSMWQPTVQPAVLISEGSWKVGFGAEDITPDHKSQDVYLAGFGLNRIATDVNDSLWARAAVFQNGDVTLGIVVLDLTGLFYNDVEIIRRSVYEQTGIDHLIVLTTHNHNSPDTMGLWGKSPIKNGIDPAYQEMVRQKASKSVVEAYDTLQDVKIKISQQQVDGLQRDSRIPHVYDTTVTTLVFEGNGGVVGSLVHWSNHPEALGGDNTVITSDFPHYVREIMEEHLGGVCLYVNGAIGGLINPLRIEVYKEDGTVAMNNSFEKAEAIGIKVAQTALSSLADAKELGTSLKLSTVPVYLPISNPSFRLLALIGGLNRATYWRGLPLWRLGTHLKSEVGVLTIGELQIALVPGELFPELFYGGYLGKEEAAKPDIEHEPIIRDYMKGEINLVFGMANDELGYIVPENDFIYGTTLGGRRTDRTGRSHYEETMSLGKETARRLSEAILMAIDSLDMEG